MDKSDFLFLVNQQKKLVRKHPQGLRNWKSTLSLVRPPPFGTQTNAQVRRFNRSLLKAQGGISVKKSRRGSSARRRSSSDKASASTSSTQNIRESASTPGLLSTDDGATTEVARFGSSSSSSVSQMSASNSVADWSPICSYQEEIDRTSGGALEYLQHPFYDPVGRRSAPAFSLSGRPREPIREEDELPEYVLERGPHGTYTRRRIGFLDVHESLKKLATSNPAFSIRGRFPEPLPATHGGTSIGRSHIDWRGTKPDGTLAGHTFGVRHRHLDKVDGSTSVAPAPDAYDATKAFEALRRPGLKFQEVTMGIPLVDLVSKDLGSFPGPGTYKLPPAINTNFDVKTNRFRRTRGGYMPLRHKVGQPRTRPAEKELEAKAELYAARLCGRTPEDLARKVEVKALKEKRRKRRVARNKREAFAREEAERAALAREAEKKEKERRAAEEKRKAAETAAAAKSIY